MTHRFGFAAKRRFGVALAWLAALALGCETTQVDVQTTQDTDWSRFETFFLAPVAEDPIEQRIRSEIGRELETRGFRSKSSRADLFVRFELVAAPRTRLRNRGEPEADVYVREKYLEKTLTVEILDPERNETVWSAVGTTRVFDPEALESRAVAAVREIFARFPAPAPESDPAT